MSYIFKTKRRNNNLTFSLSAFKFFQQKKTVSFTTEPQNFKETSSQLQKSSSSIRLIKSFFNLKKKD